MIKFDHVKEYLTLAETLNFTRTAELCFIAQPALSRHIALIEEEMGAKLLIRSTRSVSLTEAGKAVYESFRNILSDYEQAKERATRLSAGKSGTLVLSVPYYWTEDFIEPVMMSFLKENPQCEIQVLSCQPLEGFRDMVNGISDIALSMGNLKNMLDNIRYVNFACEHLCAIVLISDPLAKRQNLRFEELNGKPFVFIGQAGYEASNKNILELLKAHGVTPSAIHYSEQVETLGMTIRKTGGVSVMPYGVRNMNRSYLSIVPVEDEDCKLPMYLCYREDNDNALIPRFILEAKSKHSL